MISPLYRHALVISATSLFLAACPKQASSPNAHTCATDLECSSDQQCDKGKGDAIGACVPKKADSKTASKNSKDKSGLPDNKKTCLVDTDCSSGQACKKDGGLTGVCDKKPKGGKATSAKSTLPDNGAQKKTCFTDFDCSSGQKCKKGGSDLSGTCAKGK